jgi:hypothetical protein
MLGFPYSKHIIGVERREVVGNTRKVTGVLKAKGHG